MQPGANLLAVSLHNQSASSSDLAFRLHSLRAGIWSRPVPVAINVTDAGLPPAPVADSYVFPQFAPAADSRFLVNGSLYANDPVFSDDGTMPDPVLQVETAGSTAGPVTVDVATGHFRVALPAGFFGRAEFSYRLRDKDGWSPFVPVVLTIPGSSPFEVWLETEFGPDNFTANPADDPDQDGVPNLIEYYVRTKPAVRDVAPPLNIAIAGGLAELTFETPVLTNNPGGLLVESSVSPDDPLSWRTEATLAQGHPVLVSSRLSNTALSAVNSGSGKWQHRLQCPLEAGTRLYRLKASTGGQWWRRP